MTGIPLYTLDSVDAVLRRRGHSPQATGNVRDILLPLDGERVLTEEEINRYRELFGKASFRKLLRKLTSSQDVVPTREFKPIAGKEASGYIDFLVALGIVEPASDGARLIRKVDNIGPSLEWYVADLCEREFYGSANWSVKLGGLPTGGDFDVLAWLSPTLAYIEVKSAAPSEVSDKELMHFLQRGQELAPEMTVLLIDTDDDLGPLLDRLFEIMLPLLRVSSGIHDPAWRPDKPFIRRQEDYPGVSFGFRKFYVTSSAPSVLTQLRRCLQHYHAQVKGAGFWGGPPINFVTGHVGEQP